MSFLDRFLEPPRLRADEEGEERRATWLELFVDLVFVVAVGQVARELVQDHSALGFLRFAGLFVPVWWAWVGVTFYADRFDTDDVVFRLLMLGEMLGVAALASTTGDALHGGSGGYALSYVAVRLVLLAAYVRAHRHVPEARPLTRRYAAGFTLAAAIWALSLTVPAPARYAVWAVALTVDMGTPLLSRRQIESAPISASHIPERIGLFAIIVLGEAVIAVVSGTTDTNWNGRALVVAVGGFAAAAAIWWIYFDTLDSTILRRSVAAGQVYLYAHLPLLAGLAAAGAGVEIAIEDAAHGSLTEGARWALFGGLAVCLAAMTVIHVTATRAVRERDLWLRIVVALGAVVVAAVTVSAFIAVGVVVVLLSGLVAVELGHEEHGSERAAQP